MVMDLMSSQWFLVGGTCCFQKKHEKNSCFNLLDRKLSWDLWLLRALMLTDPFIVQSSMKQNPANYLIHPKGNSKNRSAQFDQVHRSTQRYPNLTNQFNQIPKQQMKHQGICQSGCGGEVRKLTKLGSYAQLPKEIRPYSYYSREC